jgi:hypothetical protein
MKKLVENYSFNAAAKQITLTDYTSIDLESLLIITNVSSNIIIYNFAGQGKGATIAANVITLDFDTTAMSNSDKLQIFIDDGESPATNSALETIDLLLSQLLKRSESLAVTDTAQRQRVVVDGSVNVAGSIIAVDANGNPVFNPSSTTTYFRYASVPEVWRTTDIARQAYQQCIRANLSF